MRKRIGIFASAGIAAVLAASVCGCRQASVAAAGTVPAAMPETAAGTSGVGSVPSLAPPPLSVAAAPSAAQPAQAAYAPDHSAESIAYLRWLMQFDGDRRSLDADAMSKMRSAIAAERAENSLSDNAPAPGTVQDPASVMRSAAEGYRQLSDTFRSHPAPGLCALIAQSYGKMLGANYAGLAQIATVQQTAQTAMSEGGNVQSQADRMQFSGATWKQASESARQEVNAALAAYAASHPDLPTDIAAFRVQP